MQCDVKGGNVRRDGCLRLHSDPAADMLPLCRPISKNKAFRMTRIIQAAKIYNSEESLATAASQEGRRTQSRQRRAESSKAVPAEALLQEWRD